MRKRILFLQGPPSYFARYLADYLEQHGAECLRINLCFSDWYSWLGRSSHNYRGTLEQWPDFLRDYLQKHQVTDILYFADCLPYHKVARELAESLDINAIAYEHGYLRPNWLTLERGGMSQFSHFPNDPEYILEQGRHLPKPDLEPGKLHAFWHEAVHEVSFHLFNYLFHFTFPRYRSDRYYNPIREYLSYIPRNLKKSANEKTADLLIEQLASDQTRFFLFAMQMQNDYQLRANSSFGHQAEAIERAADALAVSVETATHLVFKMHPMDNGIEPWGKIVEQIATRYGLEGRLHLIDGGELSRVLVLSQGVITINSTVGLHALQAKRPTKVLGQSLYDIAGLTSQQALAEFIQKPQGPDGPLLEAFIRLLANSIQIKGNFFNREGRLSAFKGIADKLLGNAVNHPNAFVYPAPRLMVNEEAGC